MYASCKFWMCFRPTRTRIRLEINFHIFDRPSVTCVAISRFSTLQRPFTNNKFGTPFRKPSQTHPNPSTPLHPRLNERWKHSKQVKRKYYDGKHSINLSPYIYTFAKCTVFFLAFIWLFITLNYLPSIQSRLLWRYSFRFQYVSTYV